MAAAGVALHFPSATPRPYRLAGNQLASVWFDRYDLPPTAPEDTASLAPSLAQLHAVLDRLEAQGIPPERIAIGGFSYPHNPRR